MDHLVKYLNETYEVRKKKNARYSLRSFARDLDISSGRLVSIMQLKELPGEVTLGKIFSSLSTAEEKKDKILKDLKRARFKPKDHGFEKVLDSSQVEQMGHWQTWAIYTLMQRQDFDGSAEWLAQKTELEAEFVKERLQALVHIGLVRFEDKKYLLKIGNVTSGSGIPSKVMRELHKQFIQRGVESIEAVDIQFRDISGITFCMEQDKMDEARTLITEFRSKMAGLVRSETPKSELYQLSVQFYPLLLKGEK
ncbi:MAG: DUF4423 domain-containing protein [Pseudobdellovibrio sp.]|nr:DUF4423 domain-containing protein [Pseudobdellovibrio sp.]